MTALFSLVPLPHVAGGAVAFGCVAGLGAIFATLAMFMGGEENSASAPDGRETADTPPASDGAWEQSLAVPPWEPFVSDGFGSDEESAGTHDFPLRICGEIHRMRKRLEAMPSDLVGVNALKHSLARMEEAAQALGYEIVDLAGGRYVDGMNVEARFIPGDPSQGEEEIITNVLRPQVNYNGVMIQQAKVEVSKTY